MPSFVIPPAAVVPVVPVCLPAGCPLPSSVQPHRRPCPSSSLAIAVCLNESRHADLWMRPVSSSVAARVVTCPATAGWWPRVAGLPTAATATLRPPSLAASPLVRIATLHGLPPDVPPAAVFPRSGLPAAATSLRDHGIRLHSPALLMQLRPMLHPLRSSAPKALFHEMFHTAGKSARLHLIHPN